MKVQVPPMSVVRGWPPNSASILLGFPQANAERNVVFCYGQKIFVPHAPLELPTHLIVHEGMHALQQVVVGGPETWWRRYIDEPEFRLAQEVEAYRAQWQYAVRKMNSRARMELLGMICRDLSGRLYGSLVSVSEARRLVTAA